MFNHIRQLLRLAGPLILSASTIMAMQIIDTYVLSWHSAEAVAAITWHPLAMAFIFITVSIPLVMISGKGAHYCRGQPHFEICGCILPGGCRQHPILLVWILAAGGDTRWWARIIFSNFGIFDTELFFLLLLKIITYDVEFLILTHH